VGAQWKAENVPQYLKLRCAYLNGDIAWVFLLIAKLGCSQIIGDDNLFPERG